jgi:hypothetical protein
MEENYGASFCWNSNFISFFLAALCKTKTVRKTDGTCACGFMIEGGFTWRAAADKCKSLGARLPEVKSVQENIDIGGFAVSIIFEDKINK